LKTAPDAALAPTLLRRTFPAPAAGSPGGWLRVIDSPTTGGPARYPIEYAEVSIGASDRSQIRLTGDTTVSRAHASIRWSEGDLFLSDNNSTNGTTVNGQAVQPAHRVALNPGDRIGIGQFVLLLEAADFR
jgi:predicted component of type VI protein secretion system